MAFCAGARGHYRRWQSHQAGWHTLFVAVDHWMERKREALAEVGVHSQVWPFEATQEAIASAGKVIERD